MKKRRRSQPLRYRIRKGILDLLSRNDYQPGDKIPTEQELIEEFNVSRSTLREGLHLLEEERVLRTKHGSGRFLLTSIQDINVDVTELQSVTHMLEGYGISGTIKVLDISEISADETVASHLDLVKGDPVVSIERIRYVEEVPVIYSIDMLPKRILKNPWSKSDFSGSLLYYLETQYGILLDHSRSTISALLLEDALATRIGVNPFIPWILFEQINCGQNYEPIIFSKDYHRADQFKFHITRYSR